MNVLDPSIKKEPFSEAEDQVLIQAHLRLGNQWSQISAASGMLSFLCSSVVLLTWLLFCGQ